MSNTSTDPSVIRSGAAAPPGPRILLPESTMLVSGNGLAIGCQLPARAVETDTHVAVANSAITHQCWLVLNILIAHPCRLATSQPYWRWVDVSNEPLRAYLTEKPL